MSERINKALARVGVASRRGVEKLINEGKVTVDGRPAKLGEQVTSKSVIKVDGKWINLGNAEVVVRHVIAYHKPEGELCTVSDPKGRPTIFQGIGRYSHGRLISVGRLDFNTSGLLLLTTDGELAHRLMHPSHEVERVYRARVRGELNEKARARLLKGVVIDGRKAAFNSIKPQRGDAGSANRWYTVSLAEGRNREVRKLFDAVGNTVNRLVRIEYGPISLPRDLRPGRWMELNDSEMSQLAKAVSLDHA